MNDKSKAVLESVERLQCTAYDACAAVVRQRMLELMRAWQLRFPKRRLEFNNSMGQEHFEIDGKMRHYEDWVHGIDAHRYGDIWSLLLEAVAVYDGANEHVHNLCVDNIMLKPLEPRVVTT